MMPIFLPAKKIVKICLTLSEEIPCALGVTVNAY